MAFLTGELLQILDTNVSESTSQQRYAQSVW